MDSHSHHNSHVVEDFMGFLQLYSDGTVSRSDDMKFPFPIITDDSVVFRDVLYDESHNLHLRLYKPTTTANHSKSNHHPLPVVYFFHGGGFCFGSRLWPSSHNTCVRLASGLEAFVVAPDYRLAPEHRLPAAMDDAVSAVGWLQKQAKGDGKNHEWWLNENGEVVVDFERVFIMGDSSGGNIAHQLAVRLGSTVVPAPAPIRVRGFVLLAPFFGGFERTKSEEGPSEEHLNLEALDRFWRLSLPGGADRDDPLANPFGEASMRLEGVELEPILVMVGENELLKDRVLNYAQTLKKMGKKIDYVQFKGKQHGFFTNNYKDFKLVDEVLQIIKRFMLFASHSAMS